MPGDKWQTPPEVYDELNNEFHFNHDPCPITWKVGDPDGLTTEWGTRTFCNPPYSNPSPWIKKARDESRKGKLVVMLMNATTDTIAFHTYIYPESQKPDGKVEIRFRSKRIKFINPETGKRMGTNPHASMVVIFKP